MNGRVGELRLLDIRGRIDARRRGDERRKDRRERRRLRRTGDLSRGIRITIGAEFTRPIITREAIIPIVARRFLALLIGPVVARAAVGLTIVRTIRATLIAAIALRLPVVLIGRPVLIGLALRLWLRLNGRGKAGLRLIRRRRPLGRRGEAIGQAAHIVVIVHIVGVALAWRPRAAVLLLKLGRLRGGDQAIIVFGVLEIVLRRDRVAVGMGVARQLQIFFRDVMGVAANLNIRPV